MVKGKPVIRAEPVELPLFVRATKPFTVTCLPILVYVAKVEAS